MIFQRSWKVISAQFRIEQDFGQVFQIPLVTVMVLNEQI